MKSGIVKSENKYMDDMRLMDVNILISMLYSTMI